MWKIGLFHKLDSGAPWSPFQELFQLHHRMLGSTYHHLHRTVREVPNESPEFERAGLVEYKPAKPDSLYPTPDDVARLRHRPAPYPWARRAARRRYHHVYTRATTISAGITISSALVA